MNLPSKSTRLIFIIILALSSLGISSYIYYSHKSKEWAALNLLQSNNTIKRLDGAEYLASMKSTDAIEYWKKLIISRARVHAGEGELIGPYDDWVFTILNQMGPNGRKVISELIHHEDKAVPEWVLFIFESGSECWNEDFKFLTSDLIQLFKSSKHFDRAEKFERILPLIQLSGLKNAQFSSFLNPLLSEKLSEDETDQISSLIPEEADHRLKFPISTLKLILNQNDFFIRYRILNYLKVMSSYGERTTELNSLMPLIFKLAAPSNEGIAYEAHSFLVTAGHDLLKDYDADFAKVYPSFNSSFGGKDALLVPKNLSELGPLSQKAVLNDLFGSTRPKDILLFDNFFKKHERKNSFTSKIETFIYPIENEDLEPLYFSIFPFCLEFGDRSDLEKIYTLLTKPLNRLEESYAFLISLTNSKKTKLKDIGTDLLRRFLVNHERIVENWNRSEEKVLKKIQEYETQYKKTRKVDEAIYSTITEFLQIEYSDSLELYKRIKILNKCEFTKDPNFIPDPETIYTWAKESMYEISDAKRTDFFPYKLFVLADEQKPNQLILQLLDDANISSTSPWKKRHDGPTINYAALLTLFLGYTSTDIYKKLYDIETSKPKLDPSSSIPFCLWWQRNGEDSQWEERAVSYFTRVSTLANDLIPNFPLPQSKSKKIQLTQNLIRFLSSIQDNRSPHRLAGQVFWPKLFVNMGTDIREIIIAHLATQKVPDELTSIYLHYLHQHKLIGKKESLQILKFANEDEVPLSFLHKFIHIHRSLPVSTSRVKEIVLKHTIKIESYNLNAIIDSCESSSLGKEFFYPELEKLLHSDESELRGLALWHLRDHAEIEDRLLQALYERTRISTVSPGFPWDSFEYDAYNCLVHFKGKAKRTADLLWNKLKELDGIPNLDGSGEPYVTLIEMGTHQSEIFSHIKKSFDQGHPVNYSTLFDIFYMVSEPPKELIPILISLLPQSLTNDHLGWVYGILGSYGPKAKEAIKPLEELLGQTRDPYDILEILETLSAIKNESQI